MSSTPITSYLQAQDAKFTLHHHVPVFTMEDVLNNLQFPPDQLLKTLVFKVTSGLFILAVLRGSDKVSYGKLAKAVGVERSSLIRPTKEEVEEFLGVQVGGISPISIKSGTVTLIDQNIIGLQTVYCGVGQNDATLEISLEELLRVTNAKVASIS